MLNWSPERDPVALATALERILTDADRASVWRERPASTATTSVGRRRANVDLFRSALLHRRRALGRLASASEEVRA
jgi:hypothetical protein